MEKKPARPGAYHVRMKNDAWFRGGRPGLKIVHSFNSTVEAELRHRLSPLTIIFSMQGPRSLKTSVVGLPGLRKNYCFERESSVFGGASSIKLPPDQSPSDNPSPRRIGILFLAMYLKTG